MLRDQGYAEKPCDIHVQHGRPDGSISYELRDDDRGTLQLLGADVRIRSSTVAAYPTTSFCVETRLKEDGSSGSTALSTAVNSPFGW